MVKLLEDTFGEYFAFLPSSEILLSKYGKNKGGPNPGLEQCKGARIAVVVETSPDEPIDANEVKIKTGGDSYFNRSLNKEGGKRTNTYKLIHISNWIPFTPNADDAYKNREIYIPFLSQWVTNAPASESEQFRQKKFKCDEMFYKKLRTYVQGQIYLMFKYFPIYKKEGIRNLPLLVLNVTRAHQQENDPLFQFAAQKIGFKYIPNSDKTPDPSYIITTIELYSHFKRWFMATYPDNKVIDQIRFRGEMLKSDRLGPQNEYHQWAGIKIKELDDKKDDEKNSDKKKKREKTSPQFLKI